MSRRVEPKHFVRVLLNRLRSPPCRIIASRTAKYLRQISMNVNKMQTRFSRTAPRKRFPKYLRIKTRENHIFTYHLERIERKEMRTTTGNRGAYGKRVVARVRTRFFPLRCNKFRNLEYIFCAPRTL